jgi:hypothetical protein
MVSPTLALWLVPPLVPVIGIVMLPVAADGDVETVRVDVPDPLTDAGLKLAVTPEGRLPVLKATMPVKPFSAPTVTVYLPRALPSPGSRGCRSRR